MTKTINKILANFPKESTVLPPKYQEIYQEEYKRGRTPNGVFLGLVHLVESWMHRKVSKKSGKRILEIGAGTLNHFPYEKDWEVYDIVEPMPYLYRGSEYEPFITNHYNRISDLSKLNRYDKIVSVAVFEHMANLPLEIALLSRNASENTIFSIGIPNEGGFLWWLSWRCTTGLSFWLRHRLDYGVMMKHEHINTAPEIIAVCDHLFKDITIKRFPIIGHHSSLFTVIDAKGIDVTKCAEILKKNCM